MQRFTHKYDEIITLDTIFKSWNKFLSRKRFKKDVSNFSIDLFTNINQIYTELKNKTYQHSGYLHFKVNDQKPRDIHKAIVKDRIVHRLVYDTLYNYFDDKFIYDSYSCRKKKGVHKAITRYKFFSRKISQNYTKQVWVLKCDIKKCFASVKQDVLLKLLYKYIEDETMLILLKGILKSFPKGLPLGNLTSQLLINIYLHELDIFIKHNLRQKYYIRYADDFVIFNTDKIELNNIFFKIQKFLKEELFLELHSKINIQTIYSGVMFLGWRHYSKHRILRSSTKHRAIVGLQSKEEKVINAYLGLLKWGNTHKIMEKYNKEINFDIL